MRERTYIYTIHTNDFKDLNGMKASSKGKIINLINEYFDCIAIENRSIGVNKIITYTIDYEKHTLDFTIIGYYGNKCFTIDVTKQSFNSDM